MNKHLEALNYETSTSEVRGRGRSTLCYTNGTAAMAVKVIDTNLGRPHVTASIHLGSIMEKACTVAYFDTMEDSQMVSHRVELPCGGSFNINATKEETGVYRYMAGLALVEGHIISHLPDGESYYRYIDRDSDNNIVKERRYEYKGSTLVKQTSIEYLAGDFYYGMYVTAEGRVVAGCRDFASIEEAKDHWESILQIDTNTTRANRAKKFLKALRKYETKSRLTRTINRLKAYWTKK